MRHKIGFVDKRPRGNLKEYVRSEGDSLRLKPTPMFCLQRCLAGRWRLMACGILHRSKGPLPLRLD